MIKKVSYFILLFFILALIGLLLIWIVKLYRNRVKGVSITKIRQEDIVIDRFEASNSGLKYYYEPKPGKMELKADWLKDKIVYTINSNSLNERFNYNLDKPKSTYRIITLGDSFTFGQNVPTKDNYSEVLEDLLNANCVNSNISKFEVINLGVFGYDIEYSVERLIRRGVKYQPDLVLWLVNSWNITNINEYTIPLIKEYISNGIQRFNSTNRSYEADRRSLNDIYKKYGEKFIQDYQKKVIDRLLSIYPKKMIIVSFKGELDKVPFFRDYILSRTKRYNFFEIFDYNNETKFLLIDKHPNVEGHKKIANELFNFLGLKCDKTYN